MKLPLFAYSRALVFSDAAGSAFTAQEVAAKLGKVMAEVEQLRSQLSDQGAALARIADLERALDSSQWQIEEVTVDRRACIDALEFQIADLKSALDAARQATEAAVRREQAARSGCTCQRWDNETQRMVPAACPECAE